MAKLIKANKSHTSHILKFLQNMAREYATVDYDENIYLREDIFIENVEKSFAENVHWFLFEHDGGYIGACHLQPIFSYWIKKKRYYLGGFYIDPAYRGKGIFRQIYQQLQNWAKANDGNMIVSLIHKDHDHSLNAFNAVGMIEDEYKYCFDKWSND